MTDQELIQALIDYAKQDDWPIVDSDVLQLAAARMAALSRVEAERDATQKEIERMKGIMRQRGIMVIPSKHPGGRPEWNISRGAQGEG